MDIKTSTVSELKALAYDHLVEIERLQAGLQAVNKEISLKLNELKEMPEAPVEVIKKSK